MRRFKRRVEVASRVASALTMDVAEIVRDQMKAGDNPASRSAAGSTDGRADISDALNWRTGQKRARNDVRAKGVNDVPAKP